MRPLYIYKVGPVPCTWDEYDSFVIIAFSDEEARELAHKESHQTSFLKAEVVLLGLAESAAGPEIILGSYNAG